MLNDIDRCKNIYNLGDDNNKCSRKKECKHLFSWTGEKKSKKLSITLSSTIIPATREQAEQQIRRVLGS